MVFIKKSEKIVNFLKNYREKTPDSGSDVADAGKPDDDVPFIELGQLERFLKSWNERFSEDLCYLHELISLEDLCYTLGYREWEREKEFDTPEWRRTKEKMQRRKEEREYQRMLSNNSSGKKKQNFSLLAPGESVKDIEQSMSFGVSFIFSLFLSGLSGYYFGVYGVGLNTTKSLFLAAFATIATIIIETFLFMIKIGKKTEKNAKKDREKAL